MGPINPNLITFDAPTQFAEDNSTMPANTVARYEYGFARAAAGPFTGIISDTDLVAASNGKQFHQIDVSGLALGQWYVAGRAVSKDGPVSDWSAAAPFEVKAKTPKPPGNFAIG